MKTSIKSFLIAAFISILLNTKSSECRVATYNLTRLMVVVSRLQDSTLGTLVKPARIPHIRSTPGKITKFRVPLEFTVNSHLIRRLTMHSSKYRICSKKSRQESWTENSKQSPPCIRSVRLSIPIDLDIPINTESILEENDGNRGRGDSKNNMEGPMDDMDAVQSFDGPERYYARTRKNYYHSQVPNGDARRARRVKRMENVVAFHALDDSENYEKKK